MQQSLALAKARWLVTFGIEPVRPETGYGYIQRGDPIIGSESSFKAKKFVEKPVRENAEKMLAQGGFHWNAGIFLFRADTYLTALETYSPKILEAARQAFEAGKRQEDTILPDASFFESSPSDSIDYAVMEKADKVAVTPINPGWSDVGSWDSLAEIRTPDNQNNSIAGDVTLVDCSDVFVQADGVEVAAYGLKDLIIVADGKRILVLPKDQSQNVKKILQQRNQAE